MIKCINSILLFTLVLSSQYIHATQSTNSTTIQATTKNHSENSSIEKEILVYVNKSRAEHGLRPLKMNERISKEARQHSVDMATKRIGFGHDGFSKRINRVFKELSSSRGGAENVAYAYKSAQEVVSQWLTSSGHRRNIMGHYDLTGIGVTYDQHGKLYFTQIFVRTA